MRSEAIRGVMIFSSLSAREKIILSVTLFIASGSILYGAAIGPFIKKWSGLDSQLAAKKVKLQKSLKLLNRHEFIGAEYKKYRHLIKPSGISDEQQMASLLSGTEAIARKSGVYISVLKPQIVKDMPACQKFIAEVELDASMPDLIRFLYEIENSVDLLKVESVDINAKSEQKGLVKVRLFISKISFKD